METSRLTPNSIIRSASLRLCWNSLTTILIHHRHRTSSTRCITSKQCHSAECITFIVSSFSLKHSPPITDVLIRPTQISSSLLQTSSCPFHHEGSRLTIGSLRIIFSLKIPTYLITKPISSHVHCKLKNHWSSLIL